MKKPNLKLTAKDFEGFFKRSAWNLTEKEGLAIASDLKTLLQFLIDNEKEMNIDLENCEEKLDCGTYRCVAGWWCAFLGKRIRFNQHFTFFFEYTFISPASLISELFECYRFEWEYFFGCKEHGTLQARLKKTNELIKFIKD